MILKQYVKPWGNISALGSRYEHDSRDVTETSIQELSLPVNIQKAQIKHPRAIPCIIRFSDADSMYAADNSRNTTSSEGEQRSDSGTGNQIFITLLPIWFFRITFRLHCKTVYEH